MRPYWIAVTILLAGLGAEGLFGYGNGAQGRRRTARRAREGRGTHVWPLSFRLGQRSDVFSEPGRRGRYVGTLARGSRLPILSARPGRRCPGRWWLEIAPRAYVCSSHGRGEWRFPRATPQPVLPPGRLVPRRVYYARRDGVPVYLRRADARAARSDHLVERGFSFALRYTARIGGKRFLHTRKGEYVPREDLWIYRPSTFRGRHRLGGGTRPGPGAGAGAAGSAGHGASAGPADLGCVVAYRSAAVRAAPGPRARRVGRIPYHRWVSLGETVRRGRHRYVRIGPERWVRASAVRRIQTTSPPPGVGSTTRWVEVLLGNQTLVAYEGARPVFATLVSTGRRDHRTPSGLFRVHTKVALSTMTNRKGAGELYRVDAVPWILYFHEGFALHGTYWHDGFGNPKSHGCVNLSPQDARWLFDWAPPRLPRGWAAIASSGQRRGLLVRVRRGVHSVVRYRGPRDQAP